MKASFYPIALSLLLLLFGCADKKQSFYINGKPQGQNLQIKVEPGTHWTHLMPVMKFIKIKNHPQIAIWLEDDAGNFVQSIYVTKKSGTQGWLRGPGDPTPKDQIHRYESLPYWMYKQNVEFEPGVLMPTINHPLPGHITSATPRKSFVAHSVKPNHRKYYVLMEINQSTDFNGFYSSEKTKGQDGYSGGTWGSGQPSVVYRTMIDQNQPQQEYKMQLIGHGSPDGSDGNLYEEMSALSTALSILSSAVVSID